MAKNTSILLGEYFESLINEQVKTGRFSSASEVVRTALRLFEQEEIRKKTLVNELKLGEKSGFVTAFNRKQHLKKIHSRHSAE
jgi:antitoxin ParD1/3/4